MGNVPADKTTVRASKEEEVAELAVVALVEAAAAAVASEVLVGVGAAAALAPPAMPVAVLAAPLPSQVPRCSGRRICLHGPLCRATEPRGFDPGGVR